MLSGFELYPRWVPLKRNRKTSRRPIAAGGKGNFSKRKDVDIGDTDGGLINWD